MNQQTANSFSSTFSRVAKYTVVRVILLFITVVIAVYLTIFIANLGGYVDEVIRNRIALAIAGMRRGGWLNDVPTEERNEIIEQTMQAMEEAAGLNEPFVIRCFRWLGHGLTLNWGETNIDSSPWSSRTKDIRIVILDNLPRTLLIFGTANLFLFFTNVFLALPLSKKYGGWLDRLVIALSPLSSAPSWVFGIVLNLIFIRVLGIMSTGGTFDAWPSEFTLAYIPMVLKQMILPFLAIFFSGLFQGVYAWRTFFLIFSREDYVDMARAKGLPPRMIERRYILRPVLPNLITGFALLFISLWQEVIALEYFFNVAGIGRLFLNAMRSFETPVMVGLVVTFAYLLAITVFFLDIIYALVDPRVRVGSEGQTARAAARKRKRRFRFRRPRRPLISRKRVLDPPPGFTPSTSGRVRASISGPIKALRRRIGNLKPTLREMARYPSAVVGLVIIVVLIGVSIYAVTAIPYDEVIELWRGSSDIWHRNPKNASPAWFNLFRKDDLPSTIIMNSRGEHVSPDGAPGKVGVASKSVTVVSEGMTEITVSFPFDFPYGVFPQDLAVHVDVRCDEKKPLLSLTWLTPDGREIEVATSSVQSSYAYYLSQDERLRRRLDGHLSWTTSTGLSPMQALFADPAAETPVPLKGSYELRLSAFVFEEDADVDAEFVLYGQVYGLAGTDHYRRDLMVALLWGMPVALSFGLLAAVGTSISTMVIAAVGTWFGGRVDSLIQRVTEVNMVLPFLPVSLMVYTLYTKSFWAILGVTVLLSIFGNAIKNYRAIFLQVKEAPYIEAARAYGASGWRIIFHYLIPRIIPVLIPQLVILVPSYVFLEATLAFLGVSDPVLPTWGKLLVDGLSRGTYGGDYHLVLEPVGLLMLVGFAFAMLGFALERIFEPRLREM